MKKLKVLFVLALFGGFLMSAGAVHAYTYTGKAVFYLCDTFEVGDSEDKVTTTVYVDSNFDFDLQYKIGGGAWTLYSTLNKWPNGNSETFDVEDELLIQFRLVNGSTILEDAEITFEDILEGYTNNYKRVIIKWTNDVQVEMLLALANDCDTFKPVPIPPSALLMGSGLVGLIGFGLRRRRSRVS